MAGVVLVAVIAGLLTLGVHFEVLFYTSRMLPRLRVRPRFRVVVAIVAAIMAHAIEALIFAGGYAILGTQAELYGEVHGIENPLIDYFYFSVVTFTSLGYGDITAVGPMRILAAVEALMGLVLVAWTASFTFVEMQRFWKES